MNKIRIIGLVLILVAIVLNYAIAENEFKDFLLGLIGGFGLGLLVAGKPPFEKKAG